MADRDLPLLNVYEIEDQGRTRHLVGFLDPVLAGARGIDSHAMIGEFTPGPGGEFDPATFRLNPEFVAAVAEYMNGQPDRSPELRDGAREIPGRRLYLVDPRNRTEPDQDPPPADVLGSFAVDPAGRIVPGSFEYNADHLWFHPESGVSGLLSDRRFYGWMHASRAE